MNNMIALIKFARILQYAGYGMILFSALSLAMDPSQFLERKTFLLVLYQCVFVFSMFYMASRIFKSLDKPRPLGLIFVSIVFLGMAYQSANLSIETISSSSDELTKPQIFYHNYMDGKIESLSNVYAHGTIKKFITWRKDGEMAYIVNQPFANNMADHYANNADQFIEEVNSFKQNYVVDGRVPIVDGLISLLCLLTSLYCFVCFIQILNFEYGTFRLVRSTIILSLIARLAYDWQWYYWNTYHTILETKFYHLVNLSSPEIYQQSLKNISYLSGFYQDILKNTYTVDILQPLIIFIFVIFYFKRPRIDQLFD